MYIDFIKNGYDDKTESERVAYIERDKKTLAEIIQNKIALVVEQIVERRYELDDIGYIAINEKFLNLLHEAEQLYCFGFYTGTVAVVGIACEEYCKFLMSENNESDVKKQNERIDVLYEKHVIELTQKKQLHQIRKIRNDCMHYNISFKNLSEECLKKSAVDILSLYKTCLLPLTKVVDEKAENEIIHQYAISQETVVREYIMKHRNILKETCGIDLQVLPGIKYVKFDSLYYIAGIDIETDMFKEMTLVDLGQKEPIPVVVDLTLPQAEHLQNFQVRPGNIIHATIVSYVSTTGQTEEWSLLNLGEICRASIKLEDIDGYL